MHKIAKVLITGHTGQLGSFLTEKCCDNAVITHGLNSCGLVINCGNDERISQCDLLNAGEVKQLLSHESYDIIFNLAALTSVAKSWEQPNAALEINTITVLNLLEAIKEVSPGTRLFQASSSEAYALTDAASISEQTPFAPASRTAHLKRSEYVSQPLQGQVFSPSNKWHIIRK